MVFLLPSLTPPPGLAKDHKKYGFFFRTPSLSRWRSLMMMGSRPFVNFFKDPFQWEKLQCNGKGLQKTKVHLVQVH